ncbi:hypothetical protein G6F60_014836 [Rhizopus arrhizus]|nr:hypothetical protein G6F60_014836 [Rhizopus arrhizus]
MVSPPGVCMRRKGDCAATVSTPCSSASAKGKANPRNTKDCGPIASRPLCAVSSSPNRSSDVVMVIARRGRSAPACGAGRCAAR